MGQAAAALVEASTAKIDACIVIDFELSQRWTVLFDCVCVILRDDVDPDGCTKLSRMDLRNRDSIPKNKAKRNRFVEPGDVRGTYTASTRVGSCFMSDVASGDCRVDVGAGAAERCERAWYTNSWSPSPGDVGTHSFGGDMSEVESIACVQACRLMGLGSAGM